MILSTCAGSQHIGGFSVIKNKMNKGKFPYSFSVHYQKKNLYAGWIAYIINMLTWTENQLRKLYNAVSAPVIATRDALAARLDSVRDPASLLYNRTMHHIGYGQETLKDIVENAAKEEEEEELVIELTKEGKRVKVFRITRGMNRDNTKIIMYKIMQHIEMRTKVIYSFLCEVHRGGGDVGRHGKTKGDRRFYQAMRNEATGFRR